MSVIDTSALLALLDRQDPHHSKAQAMLQDSPLTVTWGSLVEVAEVVRRASKGAAGGGDASARAAVAAILARPGFREAPAADLRKVIALHARQTGLSLVDAWNIVAALELGQPLASFDAHQVRVYTKEHRAKAAA